MNDWFEAERHVERAHEHYEASRWDEAEHELRRAIEINPSKAEWHFNLGLTLEAAGRIEEACASYDQAERLEPDNVQTLLALGSARLTLGDAAAAVDLLTRAHRLEPRRPDAPVALIEAHTRVGDHEQAEVMFYLAQQLEGADVATAYAHIAESLLARGLVDRAAWCLREAAQLDPRLPRVHARLAAASARLGKRERARQLYLRELRNNPGDIDTLIDLGRLLMEMNRPAEAGEKLRRVLELESDHSEAHLALGELALELRRPTEALNAFRLVLRLDPEHSRARRRAAGVLASRGEVGEARRLLRKELRSLEARPHTFTPADLGELAGLLLDARLFQDGAAVLQKLVRLRPLDADAHHHLSVAHFELGDRRRGMASCRRALRLRRDNLAAMHNLALAYAQEGRWLQAWGWAKKASALDPEDASLRRLRTRLRIVLGVTRARRAWTAARRWAARTALRTR